MVARGYFKAWTMREWISSSDHFHFKFI